MEFGLGLLVPVLTMVLLLALYVAVLLLAAKALWSLIRLGSTIRSDPRIIAEVLRPSRVAQAFALAAVLYVVVVQTFTTRGQVHASDSVPIADADVLLTDGERTLIWTRTDEQGRFRMVHALIDRGRFHLLICAQGYGAMVHSPPGTAILNSRYGLQQRTDASEFWSPERLGWELSVPPTCPSGVVPRPPQASYEPPFVKPSDAEQ